MRARTQQGIRVPGVFAIALREHWFSQCIVIAYLKNI